MVSNASKLFASAIFNIKLIINIFASFKRSTAVNKALNATGADNHILSFISLFFFSCRPDGFSSACLLRWRKLHSYLFQTFLYFQAATPGGRNANIPADVNAPVSSKIKNTMTGFKVLILSVASLFSIPVYCQNQSVTRIESVQSLYIEILKENTTLGCATGFIIKSNTQYYLITNWHVVTNKNPITKAWLDSSMKIAPNRIAIAHNGKVLGTYSARYEDLTDKKGNIIYKEFPIGKEMLDVVAIPLKDTTGNIHFYAIDYRNTSDSLLLQPTDRLFVLGFPKGIKSAPFLPIWKSGLIASEPDIDQEGKPIIWLDIESFSGMSGSPVYLITDKLMYKTGDATNMIGGSQTFFLGVFSHGQDINVGSLWKATYLKKIFNSLP